MDRARCFLQSAQQNRRQMKVGIKKMSSHVIKLAFRSFYLEYYMIFSSFSFNIISVVFIGLVQSSNLLFCKIFFSSDQDYRKVIKIKN